MGISMEMPHRNPLKQKIRPAAGSITLGEFFNYADF
jgi:hypothetical protein